MQSRGPRRLRVVIASALCLLSTPLLGDELVLRCDSPKNAISFSVLLDPAERLVRNIGFANNIKTERFTETVIAASDKEADVTQSLIIDRVTGEFQLTWLPSNGGEKGGNYMGTCALGRRLF